jgi:O-antigen/teichoic acid export membrane protein
MINQTAPDTTDELEEIAELSASEVGEIKQKSVKGAISYFFRTVVLQGLGIVSAIVLSVYFSAEDFGVYGLVVQVIGLLTFFSDIGLAAALVQKKDEPTLTEYRTVFTVQQLLSWFIFAVAVLILMTGFLQEKTGPAGGWILMMLAISFPLATFKTISSIRLERRLDFQTIVIPHIVEQVIFHGILIFLAFQGMDAMAYAYAIGLRSVIGTAVMFWLEPWKIGFALDRPALKSLLSYGVKFQLNDFLARIKDNLFFLALGMFLPLQQFGYIQWAKMWSMYPYTLTVQNIMAITFPTFSRLQANKKDLARAIESSMFFVSLGIFPILIGMSVFIGPLISVFDQFAKWEPTIPSFILFTLGIGWAAISTPLINTLNAVGHINTSLKMMIFWTVLTWVLTPILVYLFSFNGVALASFVIACTSFIPIILVKKVVPFHAWQSIFPQTVAGLVMGLVGLATYQYWSQSTTHLILGILIIGSIYVATIGVIGRTKLIQEVKYIMEK